MPPKYNQRDVVKVNALLPTGGEAVHPFLIISCNRANSKENYYTGVMMTGSAHTDGSTFEVENNMFERPLQKENCQLRLYILVSFPESKIKEFVSRMKKIHFAQVIQEIKDYVLVVDNT
jgi:hypothetical protein